MLRKAILSFLCSCTVFGGLACSVPLYKVAPIPQNISSDIGQTGTRNGLEVTAAVLTDDNQSFERFDANWPLAGVVVVDIKLVNHSPQAKTSIRFELQDATGRKFSLLAAKAALKQVMNFEGVRLYPIEGKQQTLEKLQAVALPRKLTLSAQEEQHGVLFFNAKQDVAQFKTFSLLVKEGRQTLTIPLP